MQIELLGTIAEIFHELFEPERYAALHAKYMELARQRYGEQDPRVIDGYLQEAKDASDFDTATRLLDRVDPLIRQAGLDRSPVRARWWVLKANTISSDTKQQAEYEAMLLRAIALYESTNPADLQYVNALLYLGNVYSGDRGDVARGLEFHRRAKSALALLPERNDAQAALIEFNLAIELAGMGDIAEANASYERAATLFLQTHGERDHWYWVTLSNWADGLCRQGDRERADQLFERMRRALPAKPDEKEAYHVARAQEVHGSCLTAQGRPREAIPLLEAVERQYLARPYSGVAVDVAYVRQILGSAYDRAGRPGDARRVLKQALDEFVAYAAEIHAPDNVRLMNSRARWGLFLLNQGEEEEAERQFRDVIAQDHGRNLDFTALAHAGMAQLGLRHADAGAALRASTDALRVIGTATGSHNPSNERYVWRIHAQALVRAGDLAAARDYAQRALDAYRHHDDPASAEITESTAVLEEIDRLAKK